MKERVNVLNLRDDYPLTTMHDLAMFLGGSEDSWTGDFLRLVAKSDPQHREALAKAFPQHVRAYETWMRLERPTVDVMTQILADPVRWSRC